VFASALAVTLALAVWLAHSLPADALSPAISAALFAIAAVVALVGWRLPVDRRFSYRDVAGLLILIGIYIAAAVDPEQMVRLVAGADRNP